MAAAADHARPVGMGRQLRLLMRLKRCHARRALTWFGYAAGTDLDARGDIVERIYQVYLLLLLAGAAAASWGAVLHAAAQAGVQMARMGFVPDLGTMVLVLPLAAVVVCAGSSVVSPPFKFTSADVTFIASGWFDTRMLAATDLLVRSVVVALVAGGASYVELTWLVAAVQAVPAAPSIAVGEVSVASLAGMAVAIGVLCAVVAVLMSAGGYASVRVRPGVRTRVLVGGASLAVAAVTVLALAWCAPVASACLHRVANAPASGVHLCAIMLACWALCLCAVCGIAARGADLAVAIERSGAYASRSEVRLVALIAPDTYRELRRRYRVSHRRFRPSIPLGTGVQVYGRRAVQSHLRQFEGLLRLLWIGAFLCPVGALMLTVPLPFLLRFSWAYLAVAAAGAARELSLAFREDQRVRLVRDALPVGTLELMLRDGAPACLVVTILSLAVTGGLVALVPSIPLSSLARALMLPAAFALIAALDGAQFPKKRHGMSSGMAVLVFSISCVVLSLAPAGVLELGIAAYIVWVLASFRAAV